MLVAGGGAVDTDPKIADLPVQLTEHPDNNSQRRRCQPSKPRTDEPVPVDVAPSTGLLELPERTVPDLADPLARDAQKRPNLLKGVFPRMLV